MNSINVNQLTKKYGDFKALENVSLTVKKGDIYGLVGRNGAGKTTLFKAILGLTNQDSGSISINGSSNSNELHIQRQSVGFLIGQSFFSYLSAYKNIEYYRKLKGIKDKSETERVLRIVDLYGVDKPFSKYSMGMKQRLGIANAILGNPDIVILDEPINGLDPQGIVDIRNLIHRLNKEFNMTLIVSSHILSELDLVATRFGIIDKGILIKEIEKEAQNVDMQRKVFVSTPDVDKLLSVMSKLQLEVQQVEKGVNIVNPNISNNAIILSLVENGVMIDEIKNVVESLESVYFELTGGNK